MDISFQDSQFLQNPYPVLEKIRATGPVVWNDVEKCWMLTSDALCRKISLDYARFGTWETPQAQMFGPEVFSSVDDRKAHDAVKSIWAVAFRESALEKKADILRSISQRLLDSLVDSIRDGQEHDLFIDFCRKLPPAVFATLMGISAGNCTAIVHWADTIAAAPHDGGNDLASNAWQAAQGARSELTRFMADQVEQRRRAPGDDLISRLVVSDVARTMADDTLIANCLMLIVAGSETTAKLLAKAIYTLALLPDERRKLLNDISLLPRFLEETQRWDPVVQLENRHVHEDTEIAGQPIALGEQLALLIGAANRDPARYEDPARFNLLREPINHLGFGFGIHLCLGISLARIETRIAIEEFLKRFPDYEVTNNVVYRLFYARGPDKLCISVP